MKYSSSSLDIRRHRNTIFLDLWVKRRTQTSLSEVPVKFPRRKFSQSQKELRPRHQKCLQSFSRSILLLLHLGISLAFINVPLALDTSQKWRTWFMISMCLCFHTLDRSLNAYLSNMIFDPLLDNSLLAIHTATMPLSLWVKLRDASLDAQEDPPSHVHHITETRETGTAMYNWMHKTHTLSCASHHRQGCAWTMLMHTCPNAHGPPLGTILMQKGILGICQFFSKAKTLTVNFLGT